MGIEAGDSGAPEKPHSNRQNSLGHKRQQHHRNKRNDNNKGANSNQTAQSHQANGYVSSSQVSENGLPGNDTASIDRHVLKLSTEVATIQEQLAYYRGILDERSELHRLQVELQTMKDGAEASRQYHLTTCNHLEEKLKISESECDEMKNRLRSLHEAAEEKEETLKKYEACLAQQDAADREKSGQIEDLSRKLQHSHVTAEQYRSQAEVTSKRLTQVEEAKKAREGELASLRLDVQNESDNRKLEEAARTAGIQQTQKEYKALLDQSQSKTSYLESRLKEANSELKAMDKHYKDECEKLCLKIDEINNEQRRPKAPMLSEKELLDLVSSIIPIGEDNAVHLGPSLIEQLQKAIFPNTWEHHYIFAFGTVLEFMLQHPQQFLRRPDHALYRAQPAIRFGTALDQMASQEMTTQASGKRIMTPAERTVGPPAATTVSSAPATSTLLSRLQRTSDPASASMSASQNLLPGLQATSSAGPGRPIFMQQASGDLQQQPTNLRSGPSEQASRHLPALAQSSGQPRAVVVTPVNPQVKTAQKGQTQNISNGAQQYASGEHHRQKGWSNAAQKQPDARIPQGGSPQKANISAAPSNDQRPHTKSRKQGSKVEEKFPPGMSQGRERDASTSHAADSGPAKGQSQQQNGSQKKHAQVNNTAETKPEGVNTGQEAQKGDSGKQQGKRGSNKKGSQDQQYTGPPGFEAAGQNLTASASGQLGGKSEKNPRKGENTRKNEGANVQPVFNDPSAASESKAGTGQGKKTASSNGPQSHPSWDNVNGDGSQPQRQRNRRKGGKDPAQ